MSQPTLVTDEYAQYSPIRWQSALLVLAAAGLGSLAALIILPLWLPGLSTSLNGSEPKVFWYLSRGSAIIAYILLWASMVFGLLITSKSASSLIGSANAFDLHQFMSIAGLGFSVFHALVLLGDKYFNLTLVQALVPFTVSNYRPFWVGLGQLLFYAWIVIIVSFYVRKTIGRNTWRALHYLSFAAYLLALFHGIFSGSDSGPRWAQLLYWISGSLVVFLTVYRVLLAQAHRWLKPAAE